MVGAGQDRIRVFAAVWQGVLRGAAQPAVDVAQGSGRGVVAERHIHGVHVHCTHWQVRSGAGPQDAMRQQHDLGVAHVHARHPRRRLEHALREPNATCGSQRDS